MMTDRQLRQLTAHGATAATLTVLFLLQCGVARADDQAPDGMALVVSGQQLQGEGSTWFPIIPAAVWQQFEARMPAGTVYSLSGAPITQLSAYAIDPQATGVTLPVNRSPQVLYSINGLESDISAPLSLTFPNLFDYPPGSAYLVFAYDPQIDRWIVGAPAVVSDDGSVLRQNDVSGNTKLSYYFVDDRPAYVR